MISEAWKKFTYHYFKIIGLAPTSMAKNSDSLVKIRASKIGLLYGVALILSLSTVSYLGMEIMLRSSYGGQFEKELVVIAAVDLAQLGNALLILIKYCTEQDEIVRIMNKLSDAAKLGTTVRKPIGHRSQIPSTAMIKRSLIGILNLLIFLPMLYLIFKQQFVQVMCYGFACCTFYFITNALELQYSLVVEYVRILVETINDSLRDLSINHHQRIYRIEEASEDLSLEIGRLMHLHGLLCEISDEVSYFYSFAMLCTNLLDFAAIFSTMYTVLKRLIVLRGLSYFATGITWDLFTAYYRISLPALTASVSNAIAESKKTGKLVTECMNTFYSAKVNRKLYVFSSKLIHKNINFTVYGFFVLDQAYLMSFIGALVTYLVILLQFTGFEFEERPYTGPNGTLIN